MGGRRPVAMRDLCASVTALGHTDVSTYLQSGNVLFTAAGRSEAAVARALERALARDLGLEVSVVLRSGSDLRAIIAGAPAMMETATLHVTFLRGVPEPGRGDDIDPKPFLPDTFRIDGREVYVSCSNGYGRTKLNNAFFERRLGETATTRNWRTVSALAERSVR